MAGAGEQQEPGAAAPRPAPGIRTVQALVLAVLAGVVLMLTGAETPGPFLGWYLVSSLVPATAIVLWRPGRWVLALALAVVLVPGALLTAHRLDPDRDAFDRAHDGGVVATRAAADMVTRGVNPYAADLTADLRPDHHVLAPGTAAEQANPLTRHYPYLPAAFLVQVPVVAGADLLGGPGDPRWLYALAVAAAVALLARADRPAWARAAALVAFGANCAVAVYLPWGANDAAAASLLVLGAHALRRRPVVAGVLVALALSLKALLVVALVPLAVLAVATGGRALLGRWGATVATALAATCLPYLLAAPGDFLEDTVAFNLGRTDLDYPTSGIGLAAAWPDVVTGGVALALSAALVAVVAVVGVRWLRGRPTPGAALAVAGALVVAGLLPARTFQISYLPLPVVLWAAGWLDAGRRTGAGPPDRAPAGGGVRRSSPPAAAPSGAASGNL